MLPEKIQTRLVEEIELFIDFSVDEVARPMAKKLVAEYRNDPLALAVLKEFYTVLPEVREEAVEKISLFMNQQGVLLLVLTTESYAYNVVASEDEVHILGEVGKQELPAELLNFFGYTDNDEFVKKFPPLESLAKYGVEKSDELCPVCSVSPGELHLLGCPVEVCPWCQGQLSRCDCRFEELEADELENEDQLQEFQDKLEGKGRIPYEVEQKPAYPGTSAGLDEGEDERG
ncbi:hypothetical protein [Desulfopila sp. IMCC35008]|uniref:hypothetical protein n=1 Tax=Desulfopila sp. IMCC35008 TaxID=2653858 RepID=UPI0013D523D4|nr:hypothetical protein [Desulfopila sp. IMCC35008]